MFDQDPEQPARIDYAALERGGSQPVKLTVTAQWAEIGWIGGQWQLSIGGYRAFVTDRGDAGSGHAWEWEVYGKVTTTTGAVGSTPPTRAKQPPKPQFRSTHHEQYASKDRSGESSMSWGRARFDRCIEAD